MGLREYHRKRDFTITPEPRGEETDREGRSFCVQKHAASQLHYDFRLEMEGVLKSWSVPKGPSLDPAVRRLAMQTEDHPVDYGGFEGIIPAGEYGGGTVLLWDRGTWEPVGDPHQMLRAGSLKFVLHGDKLRGQWALVRIRGRDGHHDRSWLLIKDRDEHARRGSAADIVEHRPESVATGRALEEIAAAKDRVWHSDRGRAGGAGQDQAAASRRVRAAAGRSRLAARARAVPGSREGGPQTRLEPCLATLVDAPPAGDLWLHEMKFDGYRILTRVSADGACLESRNGKDWTGRFPDVVQAVQTLALRDAILDGEVAALLPGGTTSFQALQNALAGPGAGVVYFVFDLLRLEGRDLRRARLDARKALLQEVLAGSGSAVLRFSDHVVGGGQEVFESACRLGLEGIVSKRRDAPYEGGRGRAWLKVKCLQRQEFVIGGYTDPQGGRVGIGALLLGVRDRGGPGLRFAGKVGTGFTTRTLRDLERRLSALRRPTSPFESASIPGVRRAHWVEPLLVGEVSFTEWTSDGRLRHPSFQGLREDKDPAEIVRERPKARPRAGAKRSAGASPPRRSRSVRRQAEPLPQESAAVAKATEVEGVRLTHPGRVLFSAQGVTKRALAEFYASVADRILPHVAGRPLTLVRCPEGADKPCFYMKHSGTGAPPALRRVRIREKTKDGEYLVVDDTAGLVSLAQMGVLEIHTWNSVADDLERPDRLVFDLDPDPSLPWSQVVAAARLVRKRLQALDLESFVKATGGKGLHVVVPLRRRAGWADTAAFARRLAEAIEREEPDRYTTALSKARRGGRLLLDHYRNTRGNTSVAAYSTRARPSAPVAVPVTWTELTARLGSEPWTISTLPARLRRQKRDPWPGFFDTKQALTASRLSSVR